MCMCVYVYVCVVVLALLIGGTFYNLGTEQNSVQNRLGAMYFILVTQMFGCALSSVLTCTRLHVCLSRTTD